MTGNSDAGEQSPLLSAGLVGLLVRPAAPPLGVGIAVAATFIVAETVLAYVLERIFPGMPFGVVFLLGVLVVSAGWGFGLAVSTTAVSALVYAFVHLDADGAIFPITAEDWVAIIVFVPIASMANVLVGQARLRAAEANRRRREAEESRDANRMLADQQAALRRIATLVARAVPPSQVFSAVAQELAGALALSTQPWSAMRPTVRRFCSPATTTVGRINRFRWVSAFRSMAKVCRQWCSALAARPGGTATIVRALQTSNTSMGSVCAQVSEYRSLWTAVSGAQPMSDRRDLSRYLQTPRHA
jgi:hypothetical protein